MVNVQAVVLDNLLTEFQAHGHAGWAKAGDDIVCAALTQTIRACGEALDQYPELIVTGTADTEGELSFQVGRLPGETHKAFLAGVTAVLVQGCRMLSREYPDHVKFQIIRL